MNEKRSNSVQTVCIMIIFAIFSLSALALVVTSIKSYRNISLNAESNSQLRASLSYVTNKIRAFDANSAVDIQNINGTDTLVITAVYDGDEYQTLLYYYDGNLYEQFVAKGDMFDLDDGNRITKLSSFTMEKQDDSLFHFVAKSDKGDSAQTYINISSHESREEKA